MIGVAARLRDGRIVHFAVAVAAIADQIDHDVGVEAVPILGGDRGDANHGIRILGIDVEDRDRQALGDVGSRSARSSTPPAAR